MSEKLEFSMEDLGRLSYVLQTQSEPVAHLVIYDWLRGQEADEGKHGEIWNRLWLGYTDAKSNDC